jgi:hypothetical protein
VQYHPSAGKWIIEERPLKWTIDNLPAKRQRGARAGFNNQAAASFLKVHTEEPTYEQAMKSEAKPELIKAMDEEFNALKNHKVFSEPMELPKGHRALDTKMVF